MTDNQAKYVAAFPVCGCAFHLLQTVRKRQKALQAQHQKIERERGDVLTHEKIFEFIAQFTDGDPNDKAHQKRVIDKLVNSVYLSDRRIVIYWTFGNGEYPFISKEDTDQAIEEKEKEPVATEGSGSVAIGKVLQYVGIHTFCNSQSGAL